MSQDLMFLRLFNEFAAANPQAADEWLFAEGRSGFTWDLEKEQLVFQPQDDAAQEPVDDLLPFMDNPFFIGADMASGSDETVFSKPMANEPIRPNRLSVIRISFFVLCQDCLRLSIYSREKHGEQEFCQCGGQWCGCENCNEQALLLLRGERDQNKLGLQVPISSWSPVNGCTVVGGAA